MENGEKKSVKEIAFTRFKKRIFKGFDLIVWIASSSSSSTVVPVRLELMMGVDESSWLSSKSSLLLKIAGRKTGKTGWPSKKNPFEWFITPKRRMDMKNKARYISTRFYVFVIERSDEMIFFDFDRQLQPVTPNKRFAMNSLFVRIQRRTVYVKHHLRSYLIRFVVVGYFNMFDEISFQISFTWPLS